MKIKSNIRDYTVNLEMDNHFITELKRIPHSMFVIDRNVYDLYPEFFGDIEKNKLILLDAIEENKTIDTALDICEKFTKIPAKRNSTMITIGGGICQDVSGFAANILYRGINWVLVPTTLLSSCDSCIGSKTSLNYKKYKNLLGTFYPPLRLHIYPEFFKTLTKSDYKSGLGEIVKFNVMKGEKAITRLEESIDSLLELDPTVLNEFILSSLEFKQPLIERDEFDQGDRISLNFAHTFGHAIETVSNYAIPHGTAVAIGMVMANFISCERGMLIDSTKKRIENLVKKIADITFVETHFDADKIIEAMKNDKKRKGDKLAAVLLNDLFETIVIYDLEENEVRNSLCFIQDFLKGSK